VRSGTVAPSFQTLPHAEESPAYKLKINQLLILNNILVGLTHAIGANSHDPLECGQSKLSDVGDYSLLVSSA